MRGKSTVYNVEGDLNDVGVGITTVRIDKGDY